jgi:cell division septal protein FtsQ
VGCALALLGVALSGTPRVASVSVSGAHHLSPDAVSAVTGLIGRPAFTTSTADARAAVLRLPAVREAQVRITLPDTARVEVVEREAIGRWVVGLVEWFVDDDGVLFGSADPQAAPQLRADATRPEVRIDATQGLVLRTGAGWEIRFGTPADLEQKLSNAKKMLSDNPTRRLDYVDVRSPDRIVFSPQ